MAYELVILSLAVDRLSFVPMSGPPMVEPLFPQFGFLVYSLLDSVHIVSTSRVCLTQCYSISSVAVYLFSS